MVSVNNENYNHGVMITIGSLLGDCQLDGLSLKYKSDCLELCNRAVTLPVVMTLFVVIILFSWFSRNKQG